mgnify:CR=1 FL=1
MEASEAFGSTGAQKLFKVELPMAKVVLDFLRIVNLLYAHGDSNLGPMTFMLPKKLREF